MALIYTVDASVFLNAFNPQEAGHDESHEVLSRFRETGTPLAEPALLLPEIASAIRRGTENATLAREFAHAVGSLPHLILVSLDDPLADLAVDAASKYGLRGSDAVYVAVAQRFGADLVTLDQEQRESVSKVLRTFKPAELLELEDTN